MSPQIPVIDAASDKCIGHLSAEYLNTRARDGLSFSGGGMVWKILHIAQNEDVFVLPVTGTPAPTQNFANDLRPFSFELARDIGRLDLTTGRLSDRHLDSLANQLAKRHGADEAEVKQIIKEIRATALRGLPTPTDKLIILESFKNYLIVHSLLGRSVNATLSLAFDAILTEEDLIRGIHHDGFRILIQTAVELTKGELDSVSLDLFQLSSRQMNEFLQKAVEARFPNLGQDAGKTRSSNRITPTLRKKFTSKLDLKHVKAVYEAIRDRKIGIRTLISRYAMSPLAGGIIKDYNERVSNEMESLTKANAPRLKRTLEHERVKLLCLNCSRSEGPISVTELDARPVCRQCDSGLLALIGVSDRNVRDLLARKKTGKQLSSIEAAQLTGARRTADLVLSYGKRGAIALSARGVGPQTASNILAKMQRAETEFYGDLLKAKIQYLRTRELW